MTTPRIVAAPSVDTEPEPVPTTDAAPSSLISRLRVQAQRAQEVRTLDLDVPGWQGELVLRFKPLDLDTLDRLVKPNVMSETGISETIEAMMRSCLGVFGRGDNDELVQLSDDAGPVFLEDRLATLLAFPNAGGLTGREVVLSLFGNNAFALGQFVEKLISWMGDPDARFEPGKD